MTHCGTCRGALGWSGDASRLLIQPQHSHPRLSPVGIPPVSQPASTHRRLHCRGSCRIPVPRTAARDSHHPHSHPALPRLGGFVSTGRDCPARVAPMSRREARRPEGPGSRARRAERQSSTARRALRWSRPVFLLTLTVVAGGCATMGCALSEHHTLHSAPHLRREFRPANSQREGSGLEKVHRKPAVHRSTARYAGSSMRREVNLWCVNSP